MPKFFNVHIKSKRDGSKSTLVVEAATAKDAKEAVKLNEHLTITKVDMLINVDLPGKLSNRQNGKPKG